MLIGLAFLICLLTVPLACGRVTDLALVQMRRRSLLVAGLGLQVLIISIVPEGPQGLHETVHLASYALVACFVAANWSVPYLWLIALGGALNAVAIGLNGGVMPADPGALAAAGVTSDAETFSNSASVHDPVLLFLGDVLWVPASWPVSNVFSIGDVLIVAGAFLALHTITGSRLAVRRFAAPRARLPGTSAGRLLAPERRFTRAPQRADALASRSVAHVVLLITDAELGAALAAAAEAAGHEVDVCTGEAETWDACEERTELLVVDVSSEAADGVSLVDSMRAGGELVGVRTVAVHGDADLAAKARAEEVGFDMVLARSRMEPTGPGLFAELLA